MLWPHSHLLGGPTIPKIGGWVAFRFPQILGSMGLGLLLLLSVLPQSVEAASPAKASAPLPDYGGREAPAIPVETGAGTTSPVVQAGRTLGALVIVLGGVVGVVTLLKRAGFVGDNPVTALVEGVRRRQTPPVSPAPTRLLTVEQSQSLPGGGMLHLVSVHDKTLLVGATGQSVTLLAEWEQESAPADPDVAQAEEAAFAEYLTRAGIAPITPPARAATQRVAGAANRLQDLLARAQSSDESHQ